MLYLLPGPGLNCEQRTLENNCHVLLKTRWGDLYQVPPPQEGLSDVWGLVAEDWSFVGAVSPTKPLISQEPSGVMGKSVILNDTKANYSTIYPSTCQWVYASKEDCFCPFKVVVSAPSLTNTLNQLEAPPHPTPPPCSERSCFWFTSDFGGSFPHYLLTREPNSLHIHSMWHHCCYVHLLSQVWYPLWGRSYTSLYILCIYSIPNSSPT